MPTSFTRPDPRPLESAALRGFVKDLSPLLRDALPPAPHAPVSDEIATLIDRLHAGPLGLRARRRAA
ncbi:hypothetical protein [Methylobacterium durans]|uniref:Uncharacterized protein n=1 Tax=Methylobacterium durans TaxID=2202825 RepID=A0A2U8W2D2_9HYPH|nr:hypothetical protein [Methylobacterium durans]AWN40245.1 hypothetical protein DK389_06480 [Methylobacterium durans]